MKLFSKNPKSKTPTFWVENYNEKEREVFLSLGFKERISNVPMAFREPDGRGGDTLYFRGSGNFGMFSEDEYNKFISTILTEITPKRKTVTIHQDYEF